MSGSTAIMEEVALEDLCEIAGQEADDIECNGILSAKDKSKVLDRLANNAQTKKHFQVTRFNLRFLEFLVKNRNFDQKSLFSKNEGQ